MNPILTTAEGIVEIITKTLNFNLIDLLYALRLGRNENDQEVIDKAITLCKKKNRQ